MDYEGVVRNKRVKKEPKDLPNIKSGEDSGVKLERYETANV